MWINAFTTNLLFTSNMWLWWGTYAMPSQHQQSLLAFQPSKLVKWQHHWTTKRSALARTLNNSGQTTLLEIKLSKLSLLSHKDNNMDTTRNVNLSTRMKCSICFLLLCSDMCSAYLSLVLQQDIKQFSANSKLIVLCAYTSISYKRNISLIYCM